MQEFKRIKERMLSDGWSSEQVKLFQKLFLRSLEEQSPSLKWKNIKTPNSNLLLEHESLEEPAFEEKSILLKSLVVCKLNGGLGTSMGCVGPKSAIEVREGLSFLDLIVNQIYGLNCEYKQNVPLVLMNSFNTNQDTQKIINKYGEKVGILTFQQHEFPRLRRDSLLPLSKEKYGLDASYPPGHGDFYSSIYHSGVLDQLIQDGKKFIFVSNADNLGATVDLKILKHMQKRETPFLMEVTPKTRADVKGGTLIQTEKGSLRLLEIAQVKKEYTEEFKSVKKFKIFNTNNIWINLKALKAKMDDSGGLELDVLFNKKRIQNVPTLQLETAIGAGINHFEGSVAVNVPRTRFLPVKKTDDLLLVQSNLFTLKEGCLFPNPDRQFEGLPLIRLGEYFKTFSEYQNRFKNIPDLLELDLLTVVGDVYFGQDITLRGNVILVCDDGELHLPQNAVIENKVLTGSIKMGEL